jgi:hypothetical protein
MGDEGDPLALIQGLKQGVEVAAVLDEAIRAKANVRQLVGVAHADQVRAMQRLVAADAATRCA